MLTARFVSRYSISLFVLVVFVVCSYFSVNFIWQPQDEAEQSIDNTIVSDFESHPLLVDFECYKRIRTGRQCSVPISVAFAINVQPKIDEQELLAIDYRMETRKSTDEFWLFRGQNITRAIPQHPLVTLIIALENNVQLLLRMPIHVDLFEYHFRSSLLIDCLNLTAPSDYRKEQRRSKANSVDLTKRVQNEKFFSKLHWYRQCAISPVARSIQIGMIRRELKPFFIDKLEYKFKNRRHLGALKDSMKWSLVMEEVPIELFVIYRNSSRESYITDYDSQNYEIRHYVFPKVYKVCSGILFDQLVRVPCNVKLILKPQDERFRSFHMQRIVGEMRRSGRLKANEWQQLAFQRRPQERTLKAKRRRRLDG
ncbi:hypothetical protein M3Y95_01128100 [Aphelenchoides besseyi]|nr:hypothetical protein M3Y95_01128100 [Aphelenchoides besseyi]